MKKLFKYTKGARILSLLAPLFIMVEVVTELYIPKLLQKIIDSGIGKGDIAYIKTEGLRMILLAVVGVVGAIVALYCASAAAFRFSYKLRCVCFEKIQRMGLKKTDSFTTSSLVVRLTNDTVSIQRLYQMSLRMLFRAPMLFIGGVIMAMTINLKLSLVLVLAIPPLIAIIWYRIKTSMPLFSKVQKSLDALNTFIRENLLGIRVVKNYVKEDKQSEQFSAVSDGYANITERATKLLAVVTPAMQLIMGFSTVALLLYGGKLYIQGEISRGAILAMLTYITQILSSLRMLSNILLNFSRTKVSVERINEILDTQDDIVDAPDAYGKVEKGDIEFKDVKFTYNGTAPVLCGLDMKINHGDCVAILGGTGAGKTTTINLIPRLYDITDGEILIDGRDIKTYPQSALRDAFALVPQTSVLFSDTVQNNLVFGSANVTGDDIVRALACSCSDEIVDALPDGLDTYLSRGGKNLSGGQKQRLCIARALIKNPKVLIMDDSLSAVDTATDSKIRSMIKEHYPKMTLIVVAQRILSVKTADKIYIMDDGKIVAAGSHDVLADTSDIYREIMDSQREAR